MRCAAWSRFDDNLQASTGFPRRYLWKTSIMHLLHYASFRGIRNLGHKSTSNLLSLLCFPDSIISFISFQFKWASSYGMCIICGIIIANICGYTLALTDEIKHEKLIDIDIWRRSYYAQCITRKAYYHVSYPIYMYILNCLTVVAIWVSKWNILDFCDLILIQGNVHGQRGNRFANANQLHK